MFIITTMAIAAGLASESPSDQGPAARPAIPTTMVQRIAVMSIERQADASATEIPVAGDRQPIDTPAWSQPLACKRVGVRVTC